MNLSPELITIIVSSIGGLFTIITLLWRKILVPLFKLCNNQDFFKESVEEIRRELKTNGGNSIKDAIIDLRNICNRMERRQRVIEQRTKAALHYSNVPLFETDQQGRLVWSNAHLCDITKNISNSLEGYDWINLFQEDDREEVLDEFRSCLDMNRKFNKLTKMQNHKKVRLLGYPYRISDVEHGGFLVSITEENEV
jgi:transcriptional regulator with PAS, ATPase and Fis domain